MGNWRVYASAGVFICVTVLKLLFPDATEETRAEIVRLIDMDMDYTSAITEVGAWLTEDTIQEVFELTEPNSESPEVEVMTPTPAPTANSTDAARLSIPATNDTMLQAVEAFHKEQAFYEGYDTPENVSYDNLTIPFDYVCPVDGITSSGFGYRNHPIEQVIKFHYGTDFDVETGTAIAAFADGQVTKVGTEAGYGNYVEITHDDGWTTLYAHCSDVNVGWWQEVKKGEVIALSGATGQATGPHLHFELLKDGKYTNPEFFFAA